MSFMARTVYFHWICSFIRRVRLSIHGHFCIVCYFLSIKQVFHLGFMFYPWNWMDQKQVDPETGMKGSKWKANYNIPSLHCDANSGVPCYPKFLHGHSMDFLTNDTRISWKNNPRWKRTPARKPGFAQVYGEGCGANGGKENETSMTLHSSFHYLFHLRQSVSQRMLSWWTIWSQSLWNMLW